MTLSNKRTDKLADAFRSIGEAARELGLQTHVLRYWESKFSKYVKPLKRRDGRRLFRPQDMDALRAIQMLVHDRGMTLKGAKVLLDEQGIETVLRGEARVVTVSTETRAPARPSPAKALQESVEQAFGASGQVSPVRETASVQKLENVLSEIEDVKRRLDLARRASAA